MKNSWTLNCIFVGLMLVIFQFACTTDSNNNELALLRSNLDASRILLPNGWSLSVPGKSIPLGDFPMNMVVSQDGSLLAVTNNGLSEQSIMLVDPVSFTLKDQVIIPKSWYGLMFNKDHSRLYASGGNDNLIRIYDTSSNGINEVDSMVLGQPWPVKISPTGLTLDENNENLYIVTKEDSALYKINLTSRETSRLSLGHEAFSCILSKDGSALYVSLWGGSAIALIDVETLSVLGKIRVGDHPNELLLTSDGKHLITSCANDNSVHIINTTSRTVIEKLQTACFPDAPAGSTPNALAISEDNSRLYVANADNNSLAVFDISEYW
ncbi:MAG: YncE family protein [Cyclobacteriaceae bacterium]|nr:YncE family protein [Cyclobacteriaceae bacterium]